MGKKTRSFYFAGNILQNEEYLENGSLQSVLQREPNISIEMKVKWMKDIVAGMYHLQIEKLVHRDLASRNVLVNSSM